MRCGAEREFELSPAWKERAIAAALGVFVALLAWFGGNSAIFPPELWDKICVASGIRPPPNAIPGLWFCLAAGILKVCGLSKGIFVLRFLGPISLGLLAVLAYGLITETEPASLDRRMTRSRLPPQARQVVLPE